MASKLEYTEKSDPEALNNPKSDTNSTDSPIGYNAPIHERKQLSFWTRMGCTPESFKRRTVEDEFVPLDKTLKMRHLHMIAIGGSIGAGLFVGSGSALSTGVIINPWCLECDF
jgi:amino acid transporter